MDKLLFRAPVLSFETYDPGKLELLLKEEFFQAAIRLASPDLHAELKKKGFCADRCTEKELVSLMKYYNRMSFRATPFGAFASFSVAGWSDQARLKQEQRESALLHVQASWEWLAARNADEQGLDYDKWIMTNPLVYRLGKTWRFTRSEMEANGKLQFLMQSIPAGQFNDYLIKLVWQGCLRESEVIRRLDEKFGCGSAEARDYLDFLITEQVLFTQYQGSMLQEKAKETTVEISMDIADFRGKQVLIPLASLSCFNRLAGGQDTGMPAPGVPVRQLFYTGLERRVVKGGLFIGYKDKLGAVLKVLQKICVSYEPPAFGEFKKAFAEKFGESRVPLLKAIDPDEGVGYGKLYRDIAGGGLLDGLHFPQSVQTGNDTTWTALQRLFMRIWLHRAGRSPFDPVEIGEADLATVEPGDHKLSLPQTLGVLFSLAEGGKMVMESAGGASATALTGRFSVFNEECYELCGRLAEIEVKANPGVIFAEIDQLSHLKVDNINRRRQIYPYVIPLNVYPAGEMREQLFPADLLVSVINGEVMLESAVAGKRVVPRLPSAYNFYHNDLPVYRFLCELQFQGLRSNFSFDPEKLFPGMDFYPRMVYSDVVLSLARWHLRREELELLTAKPFSFGRFHLFCQRRGIPRYVSLGRSDQQLVFDLAADEQARLFVDCLDDAGDAVIREYLQPEQSASDSFGAFAAQYMVVAYHEEMVYKPLASPSVGNKGGIIPSFSPGSEWCYLKIYCTPQSTDVVLLEVIRPLLSKLKDKYSDWFFIRYQDPEPHIRLRLRKVSAGPGGDDIGLLIKKGCSNGKYKGLVGNVKEEIYHRELDRFSPDLVELVEKVFYAGSVWAMAYLGHKHPVGGNHKWELLPFIVAYEICVAVVGDQERRMALVSRVASGFLKEFGAEKQLKVGLDRRYRELSRNLDVLLEDPGYLERSYRKEWSLVKHHLLALAGVAGRKMNLSKQETLAADLVHLQMNRIYPSRQRQHEALVWYCLFKYLQSRFARSKKSLLVPAADQQRHV